jgi:hypothetical protein
MSQLLMFLASAFGAIFTTASGGSKGASASAAAKQSSDLSGADVTKIIDTGDTSTNPAESGAGDDPEDDGDTSSDNLPDENGASIETGTDAEDDVSVENEVPVENGGSDRNTEGTGTTDPTGQDETSNQPVDAEPDDQAATPQSDDDTGTEENANSADEGADQTSNGQDTTETSSEPDSVPSGASSNAPVEVVVTTNENTENPALADSDASGGTDTGGTDTGGSDTGGSDTGGSDTGGSDTGGSTGNEPPANIAPVVDVDPETVTEVLTGRVTTLKIGGGEDAQSIKITEGPTNGNLTVNPDNTLALVLTGETATGSDSFSYRITHEDGTVEAVTTTLDLKPGPMSSSWGTGNFYTLQEDANGDSIVETGDIHRDVFVSESADALSLEDIAMIEGITVEEMGKPHEWLEAHPEYGGSADNPLDGQTAMLLWNHITDGEQGPTSHWLLFERGYEYEDLGRVMTRGMEGESELHPVHITSWGEGELPVIHARLNAYQEDTQNVVISDLYLAESAQVLQADNYLFEDVVLAGEEMNVQGGYGITIRDSAIVDAYREEPVKVTDDGKWEAVSNRMSGLFAKNLDGFLLEDTVVAHNGWAPDYRYDMSIEGGHTPSFYSHNLYIQRDNWDVTIRDNVIMEGPSTGMQFRSGGFMEDNVFIDNNIGFNVMGGGDEDGDGYFDGNYSLVNDNVVTSAAHREVMNKQGYLARGIENLAPMTSYIDNIIAHLANPNDPVEMEEKNGTNRADHFYSEQDTAYNDTIGYNWNNELTLGKPASADLNVEGLDKAVLDQTTIENFAADILDDPNASIEDLAALLRAQAAGELDHVVDADLIVAFFQEGFGLAVDLESSDGTSRFVPNALGDGVRWDNRLNWDNETLPGATADESVDLAGNWVNYGGTTVLKNVDLGSGGKLSVNHGYLEVTNALRVGKDGGEVDIDGSGQLWIDGYSDADHLDVDVAGGRFANKGDVTGDMDLSVADNGQAILATGGASFEQGAGKTLEISGSDARVGFDGDDGGVATLTLADDGTMSYVADANGLTALTEFRSGAFGDDTNVSSGVDIGGAKLMVDLSAYSGSNEILELMSVDEMIGSFGETEITGLGGRDAELIIDYSRDQVSLKLINGSGEVSVTTQGKVNHVEAENNAIWDALTEGQGVYDELLPEDPMLDDDEEMAIV